jgi:hypothetical protein
MSLRSIEIDWDIHKKIEAERRGFDEPEYAALRRLLGLPTEEIRRPEIQQTEGRPWSEDGVVVPHGSLARMSYNYGRQNYEGHFLDGKLVVNGKQYDTLSSAASDLALTKAGSKTSLNGWLYWEVRFPHKNQWERLQDLRDRL